MAKKAISKFVLQRLPKYHEYLKALPETAAPNISAKIIASALGMGEVLVRKDIACISTSGKPKIGYAISELIDDLENFLGYNDNNNAVVVGAGKLGSALLEYSGFQNYGLNVIAAFDTNEDAIVLPKSGKHILPLSNFEDICHKRNIKIGIITVPAESAQSICDLMVENGVLAIWNFAPVHLNAPENILVQQENVAASLSILSAHLNQRCVQK